MTEQEAFFFLRTMGTVVKRHGRYRVNLLHGGGATDWIDATALIALAEQIQRRPLTEQSARGATAR